MKLLRGILTGAVSVLTLAAAVPVAQAAGQTNQVVAAKDTYLSSLTTWQRCINQRGTVDARSPLFNGCVDWHSAVHAHWALYAASAMTGNRQYAQQADQSLDSSKVASELSYMRSTTVNKAADNPYGFAWMLRLARERAQLTGDTSLRPLADFAAEQAVQFSRSSAGGTEYHNASWTAIQLWEWATYTNNDNLKSQVKSYYDSTIKTRQCSLSSDDSVAGFFPPCAMRLAAMASIEGAGASSAINQAAQGYQARYRTSFKSQHSQALNFSTAYALALAGKVANNAALVENAASLVNQQMQDSAVYSRTLNESHWIPQFGIAAIQKITGQTASSPKTTQPQPSQPSQSLPDSTVNEVIVTQKPIPSTQPAQEQGSGQLPQEDAAVEGSGTDASIAQEESGVEVDPMQQAWENFVSAITGKPAQSAQQPRPDSSMPQIPASELVPNVNDQARSPEEAKRRDEVKSNLLKAAKTASTAPSDGLPDVGEPDATLPTEPNRPDANPSGKATASNVEKAVTEQTRPIIHTSRQLADTGVATPAMSVIGLITGGVGLLLLVSLAALAKAEVRRD